MTTRQMKGVVATWADAFGVWHAKVQGRGPKAYARARRAIHDELKVRYTTRTRIPPLPHIQQVSYGGCRYGCGDENCPNITTTFSEHFTWETRT